MQRCKQNYPSTHDEVDLQYLDLVQLRHFFFLLDIATSLQTALELLAEFGDLEITYLLLTMAGRKEQLLTQNLSSCHNTLHQTTIEYQMTCPDN